MQGIYNYTPKTNHVSRVMYCCSCSVFTVCATNSHVECVLYVYISTFFSLCSAKYVGFYHFHGFMLSRYVGQLLSE
jgi:hypothetical protein